MNLLSTVLKLAQTQAPHSMVDPPIMSAIADVFRDALRINRMTMVRREIASTNW